MLTAPRGPPAGTACSATDASGPIVYTAGMMARMASSAGRSSSSKLLTMTAAADSERSTSCSWNVSRTSLGSVVRRKLGKSLSRMCLLMPGAQSTGMSMNPFVS